MANPFRLPLMKKDLLDGQVDEDKSLTPKALIPQAAPATAAPAVKSPKQQRFLAIRRSLLSK